MSLEAGQIVELAVEKPAAGGRMIARHEGQVVLVRGAIPGERVRARIERADKRLAFAAADEILEVSADRVEPGFDMLCGGCLYAHVRYERQLALKADVIGDAFARLGRLPLDASPPVAASPTEGYRMRARLHVHEGRPGFYREGSHQLCDAAVTRQLAAGAIEALADAVADAQASGVTVIAADISENLPGDERAMLLELHGGGCLTAGDPTVADPLSVLTGGRAQAGELRRRPSSFFQANRFLLPRLVTRVLDAVPAEGDVIDLYAGVGLFAVSLAATGRTGITAVEGDRSASGDLKGNAAPFGDALRAVSAPVEEYLARRSRPVSTLLVDPPRTGISKAAMEAVVARRAGRIVYVSCDPATMARDARRLVDAGYRLASLEAFDLFPNTPHVESLGVFER